MTPKLGSARLAAAGLISTFFVGVFGQTGAAHADGLSVSTPTDPAIAYGTPTGGVETLGVVTVFGNDWYGIPFGDRYDRWRTGHVRLSVLRGERWNDALPAQPFELMEYRIRGEIIAPDNLATPAAGDRLYAPSWWLGATTHFGWSGYDVSTGADVVIVGPQTGIKPIHSEIHQFFGNNPINLSSADQLSNGIYLDAHAEVARGIALSFGEVRPFVELRAGAETLARVGVDVTIGTLGRDGLRLRDQVSGQRVAAVNGFPERGWLVVPAGGGHGLCRILRLPAGKPGPRPRRAAAPGPCGRQFRPRRQQFLLRPSATCRRNSKASPKGQVVGTLSFDLRF